MTEQILSRGQKRQLKTLQVAQAHFMEKGYAGTSVNDIVREAGGSLNTLYKQFGNKLGLFEAVFRQITDELFTPFLNCDYWQDDIQTNLEKFGRALQRVVFSETGIAINRLVLAEDNAEQSQIHQIFLQHGPEQAINILQRYLKCQQQMGSFYLVDTELAAAQFLEMIKGPFYYRAMFGEHIESQMLEQALMQAVQVFLHGAQCCSDAESSKRNFVTIGGDIKKE